MGETWFLKVDGVTGESAAVHHAGEIEVQSWSWGMSTSASTHVGSGAGSGKVTLEDMTVTGRITAASPKLVELCATGRHVRTVTLTGERGGGGPAADAYRYVLTDVVVVAVHHGDDDIASPTDRVVLRAATIEVTYRPQSPTGAAGAPVTVVVGAARHR
ncbi:MAG: type VI secretion system tube protein Hcp [Ilumatobacteraceae bacterium]